MREKLLLCSVVAFALWAGCSHSGHEENGAHHGDGDGVDGDDRAEADAGAQQLAIPNPSILVANGEGSLQVIDPATLKVVAAADVDVDMHPHHISIAPDRTRALITAPSEDLSAGHGGGAHGGGHGAGASSAIYALELATGELKKVLEVNATAHNAAFTKDGKTVVLGMMEHGMIAAYDALSFQETFTVTGFEMPLEVTPTNVGSLLVAESAASRVSVVDLATRKVSTQFATGAVPVAAWASGASDYFVSVEEGKQLRHLVEEESAVTMDEHIIEPNGMPGQAVLTPDGAELWVAVEDRAVLAIFNADSHESTAEFRAGVKPHGIVFEPGGARAFVTDEGGGKVLVIDVAARSISSQIDVAGKPNGIAWLGR
jgi:YVTN family beta-propeller protein